LCFEEKSVIIFTSCCRAYKGGDCMALIHLAIMATWLLGALSLLIGGIQLFLGDSQEGWENIKGGATSLVFAYSMYAVVSR